MLQHCIELNPLTIINYFQELDYNDEGEEAPELEVYDDEIEDPLFVGEQPNDTTCIAQPSQVSCSYNSLVRISMAMGLRVIRV
jgi:hypothetical protein